MLIKSLIMAALLVTGIVFLALLFLRDKRREGGNEK